MGDISVYTTPFGVGVEYECVYERAITVSDLMDVRTITAFGQKNALGNLAESFILETNGKTDSGRFIIGSELEVSMKWSLTLLQNLRTGS